MAKQHATHLANYFRGRMEVIFQDYDEKTVRDTFNNQIKDILKEASELEADLRGLGEETKSLEIFIDRLRQRLAAGVKLTSGSI